MTWCAWHVMICSGGCKTAPLPSQLCLLCVIACKSPLTLHTVHSPLDSYVVINHSYYSLPYASLTRHLLCYTVLQWLLHFWIFDCSVSSWSLRLHSSGCEVLNWVITIRLESAGVCDACIHSSEWNTSFPEKLTRRRNRLLWHLKPSSEANTAPRLRCVIPRPFRFNSLALHHQPAPKKKWPGTIVHT